jgi:hypothetical protein
MYLKPTSSKTNPCLIGFGNGFALGGLTIRGSISKKSKKSYKKKAPCDTLVNLDSIPSSKLRSCLNEPAKKVNCPNETVPLTAPIIITT